MGIYIMPILKTNVVCDIGNAVYQWLNRFVNDDLIWGVHDLTESGQNDPMLLWNWGSQNPPNADQWQGSGCIEEWILCTLSHFASVDDRLLDAGFGDRFLFVQQRSPTRVVLERTLHQLAEFCTHRQDKKWKTKNPGVWCTAVIRVQMFVNIFPIKVVIKLVNPSRVSRKCTGLKIISSSKKRKIEEWICWGNQFKVLFTYHGLIENAGTVNCKTWKMTD